MNKKTVGLISLALTLGAIIYAAYNSLKSMSLDLVDTWEDDEEEDFESI